MRIQSQIFLGWTPILAVVPDGNRRVLKVTGWEGGSGVAPAINVYVGATGYVNLITDATDIKGTTGNTGATGLSGGSYTHIQAVPASTWTIVHNLGYFPNVTVVDSANDTAEGDIVYIDSNTLTVSFNGSFSGNAYLS